ncbi:tripartite motif-containing protein 66 isoform X4 [Sciurus carolinensis]|uniref:tripartite motif-containing protein 66 isoform X4 n=1 Tax=Sciurus carolinensis TaxID=30640 RepID=UPI001FB3DF02|nr:tripartite motif-containing protein 66 isoform X4 [Sciurus carolinensis]
MKGVELARSTRCFTPEDVNGKASVPGRGTGVGVDMCMNLKRHPLADQKPCSRGGQMEAMAQMCSLCLQDVQDEGSWLLPCQHLFCKDCFQGLMQELGHIARACGTVTDELISCPGCKRVYLTRDVTEHFFLQCFPTGNPKMARNCSECKEKRAAHILCTYCNRWLCSSCTEEHRHGPAPGGSLFPRTQKGSSGVNGDSGDFALYCPLHTQEVLKLFCETCDVLTCHSCLMVEHKEHRCRHVEEVLQNQRMLLESVTAQVAHKKSSLQTSAKQIEDRIFEVKHQHRKVENQIKMAKMVLMNELNKQANGLIEELEVTDEPPASEGPKPTLPLDKNTAAALPQTSGEETSHSVPPMDNTIQHSSPNVVRKHSTSVSIMGFSNTLEMELSSTRLARTLEPQVQSVSSLTPGPPQEVPSLLSGPPQTVSNQTSVQNHSMPSLTTSHLQTMPSLVHGTFQSMPNMTNETSPAITSLASDHSQARPSLMSAHTQSVPSLVTCPLKSRPLVSDMQLETGSSSSPGSGRTADSLCSRDGADPSLGNALCKMESEDSSHFTDSVGQGPMAPGLDAPKDLAITSELEEPINLSVKRPPLAPVANTSMALQQYRNPQEYQNFEQRALEPDTKENQSIRAFNSESKIPYVRLERLKICAASSGEMPVFKLKPQKNDQDGSFLLVIECGTESSSMSIKVSQDSLPDAIQAPGLGGRKVTVTSLAGQQPPEVESTNPEEHRLISRIPGAKKGPPVPIENEDFCAVCLNGGELLCCDRCPKVYHLSCHVPALLSFPGGEWVCTLCCSLTQPEMEYDCENTRYSQSGARVLPGLSTCDQKKCEKLVLSLCCNSLSLPFHEPVSPLARHYYQIIKRPMDLSIIRRKLQKKDPAHYTTPEDVVADVRLIFWNCAKFNYPDSEVAEAGRCLEVFFEGWLKEIYPEKQFAQPRQQDSDSEEVSSESGCSTPQGFPWPPCVQEGIQPKRRRRHMENEKAKRMSFRLANSISQV